MRRQRPELQAYLLDIAYECERYDCAKKTVTEVNARVVRGRVFPHGHTSLHAVVPASRRGSVCVPRNAEHLDNLAYRPGSWRVW